MSKLRDRDKIVQVSGRPPRNLCWLPPAGHDKPFYIHEWDTDQHLEVYPLWSVNSERDHIKLPVIDHYIRKIKKNRKDKEVIRELRESSNSKDDYPQDG